MIYRKLISRGSPTSTERTMWQHGLRAAALSFMREEMFVDLHDDIVGFGFEMREAHDLKFVYFGSEMSAMMFELMYPRWLPDVEYEVAIENGD